MTELEVEYSPNRHLDIFNENINEEIGRIKSPKVDGILEILQSSTFGRTSIYQQLEHHVRNKPIMVLWSGGLDSTLLLLAAMAMGLKVDLVTVRACTPNRVAEQWNLPNLLDAIKAYTASWPGSYTHRTISIDLPVMPNSAWGQMPWWITAVQYHRKPEVTTAMFGWLLTDSNSFVFDAAIESVRAFAFTEPSPSGVQLELPFRHIGKHEVAVTFNLIAKPLRKYITFCEAPIEVRREVKGDQDINRTDWDSDYPSPLGLVRYRTAEVQHYPCGCCGSCLVLRNATNEWRSYGFDESRRLPDHNRHFTIGESLERKLRDIIQPFLLRVPVHRWGDPLNIAKILTSEPVREIPHLMLGSSEEFRRGGTSSTVHITVRQPFIGQLSQPLSDINPNWAISAETCLLEEPDTPNYETVIYRITDALIAKLIGAGTILPVGETDDSLRNAKNYRRYSDIVRSLIQASFKPYIPAKEKK